PSASFPSRRDRSARDAEGSAPVDGGAKADDAAKTAASRIARRVRTGVDLDDGNAVIQLAAILLGPWSLVISPWFFDLKPRRERAALRWVRPPMTNDQSEKNRWFPA